MANNEPSLEAQQNLLDVVRTVTDPSHSPYRTIFEGHAVSKSTFFTHRWIAKESKFEQMEPEKLKLVRFVVNENSKFGPVEVGCEYQFDASPIESNRWHVSAYKRNSCIPPKKLSEAGNILCHVHLFEKDGKKYDGIYRSGEDNDFYYGFMDDPKDLLKFCRLLKIKNIVVGIKDTAPRQKDKTNFRFRIVEVSDDLEKQINKAKKKGELLIAHNTGYAVTENVVVSNKYQGFTIYRDKNRAEKFIIGKRVKFQAEWNDKEQKFITYRFNVHYDDNKPMLFVRKPVLLDYNRLFYCFCVRGRPDPNFEGFFMTEEFGLVENYQNKIYDSRLKEMAIWVIRSPVGPETMLRRARARMEIVHIGETEPLAMNDYNEDIVPNPRTTNYTPFQVHGNETPPEEVYRPRQFRTRPKGHRNQREEVSRTTPEALPEPESIPPFILPVSDPRDVYRHNLPAELVSINLSPTPFDQKRYFISALPRIKMRIIRRNSTSTVQNQNRTWNPATTRRNEGTGPDQERNQLNQTQSAQEQTRSFSENRPVNVIVSVNAQDQKPSHRYPIFHPSDVILWSSVDPKTRLNQNNNNNTITSSSQMITVSQKQAQVEEVRVDFVTNSCFPTGSLVNVG
ncbi:hypothetical protein WR25_00023 isoform G [Diploscapter pachys]|uniref:p-granule-associated protein DEPS-1 sixth OB-fold domain-containing protein n=2 Tax=Diploscapter pachys TaxID=2018661 RepID=A0A2A2KE92_9BILA|nr:hypothetical protein WR25_00023 isoform C [Diploscapter pachys]PAV72179.1 hypothetical protein WR25_00023 isoform D [Diploscapter pachys]PAV72182.1 hypothetical protein WR25_00023 isoform G [Diploscapter pachys]